MEFNIYWRPVTNRCPAPGQSPRKRQLNTDLSDDDGRFWSSTEIEPKGCRQLVWEKGKPPEPTGKEFPPISDDSTHIRNITQQIKNINDIKELAPEDERELVLRFYDSKSDIDCTKIVEANLMVASIHANRRAGVNYSYNNLLGVSVLAMLIALRKGSSTQAKERGYQRSSST